MERRTASVTEKRKALVQWRPAQDRTHRKVHFTFLGGLACDLEPLAPAAGQRKAEGPRKAPTSTRSADCKVVLEP